MKKNKGTNFQMKRISGKEKKVEENIFEGIKRRGFPKLETGRNGGMSIFRLKKFHRRVKGETSKNPQHKIKCKSVKQK